MGYVTHTHLLYVDVLVLNVSTLNAYSRLGFLQVLMQSYAFYIQAANNDYFKYRLIFSQCFFLSTHQMHSDHCHWGAKKHRNSNIEGDSFSCPSTKLTSVLFILAAVLWCFIFFFFLTFLFMKFESLLLPVFICSVIVYRCSCSVLSLSSWTKSKLLVAGKLNRCDIYPDPPLFSSGPCC